MNTFPLVIESMVSVDGVAARDRVGGVCAGGPGRVEGVGVGTEEYEEDGDGISATSPLGDFWLQPARSVTIRKAKATIMGNFLNMATSLQRIEYKAYSL